MKRLFSFSVTSTFTFILSILAILVIAICVPGVVQAVLGPEASPASPASSAIQESPYYGPVLNPAVNFGSLTDNGTAAYMGIGISTPVSPLHIYSTSSTQPETIDLDGAQPITAQWNDYSNTGGSMSGSGFLGRFARGTRAAPAYVQSGDRLGFNVFGGWVGSWVHSAAIEAIVDSGTVNGTSLPTYMKFSTTPSGSTTRVERMRIDYNGRVGINVSNPFAGSKLHVYTENQTVGARAVFGENNNGNCGYLGGSNEGVYGYNGGGNYGYLGGSTYGAYGRYKNYGPYGTLGGNTNGVEGSSTSGNGVYGWSSDGDGVHGVSVSGNGVYGHTSTGYAGYFDGKAYVSDNLSIGVATANSTLHVKGSIASAYVKKTAEYTATVDDSFIAADATGGAFTVYLPTAVGCEGRVYTIKRINSGANAVTVDANGSQTMDGNPTYSLGTQWKYIAVVSDGSNWLISANN